MDGLNDPSLIHWKDITRLQQHWIGDCTGYRFYFPIKVGNSSNANQSWNILHSLVIGLSDHSSGCQGRVLESVKKCLRRPSDFNFACNWHVLVLKFFLLLQNGDELLPETLEIWTERPELLCGAAYIVISPNHHMNKEVYHKVRAVYLFTSLFIATLEYERHYSIPLTAFRTHPRWVNLNVSCPSSAVYFMHRFLLCSSRMYFLIISSFW